MNCREICPKWSQTTSSVKIQTQTSPALSDALLHALGPGKRLPRRESPSWFDSRGTVALGTSEDRYVSALLADLRHGREALRGHSTDERASQSLSQAASGLFRTVVEQKQIFKFFRVPLSEGLRSLLPTKNEAGRNRRTRMQLLSKEKKVSMVMGKKLGDHLRHWA